MLRRVALVASLLLGCAAVTPATAVDKFPSRPITLINPFTPGGPVDIYFRVLGPLAEKEFGVPVVIENKPGGSSTLGPATMAATAKPDGYTISQVGTGVFTMPYMQKVSFDPAKDFTYIIGLTGYRLIVAVAPDSPWKTWKDLVAAAKAQPGKISYGSTGSGGVTHLSFEQAAMALGLKFLHVPFRGASEEIAAFVGGHIAVAPTGGAIFPYIDAGTARPLLWLTRERSPRYPDVPSLKDEGIEPMVDPSFPYGIAGPKGMDPAVVKILHDGFKKVMDTPEHAKVLEQLQQDKVYMSSEDYRAFALRETEGYKKLIDALGLARKE